ncbi:MAG: YdeI/OmpD-associated family protein [Bdellovibrionia bacterium]
MKITKTLNVDNRLQWRLWLQQNHDKENEIWLVYHRAHIDVPTIRYAESVEEALCFGWVDGLLNKIDDERYARRFGPRRTNVWSKANIERFKRLKKEGRLHESAFKTAPNTKTKVYKPLRERRIVMPKEMKAALAKNKKAGTNFTNMAPSYRRLLMYWLSQAKRPETRVSRLKRIIDSLSKNKKLWGY